MKLKKFDERRIRSLARELTQCGRVRIELTPYGAGQAYTGVPKKQRPFPELEPVDWGEDYMPLSAAMEKRDWPEFLLLDFFVRSEDGGGLCNVVALWLFGMLVKAWDTWPVEGHVLWVTDDPLLLSEIALLERGTV